MAQWIPVSERLPEPGAMVAITNGKEVSAAQWWNNLRAWAVGREYIEDVITHWMPLPDPPEEAADAT
jgi:hypothetical protein